MVGYVGEDGWVSGVWVGVCVGEGWVNMRGGGGWVSGWDFGMCGWVMFGCGKGGSLCGVVKVRARVCVGLQCVLASMEMFGRVCGFLAGWLARRLGGSVDGCVYVHFV